MQTGILATVALIGMLQAASAKDHICKTLGEIAEAVMTGRQNGVPLSMMMESPRTTEMADNLTEIVIMNAFQATRAETPQQRVLVTQEFRASVELTCYEGCLARDAGCP